MRTLILDGLKPAEIRAVNFQAVADAAAAALDRGWTGPQVARVALTNLDGAKNLGAVMVANVRQLGNEDPPRTPTPPPVREVLTGRQQPANNPTTWAAKVREGIA